MSSSSTGKCQIDVMTEQLQLWGNEIQICQQDIESCQTEINSLDQEREQIEAHLQSLSNLEKLKEQVVLSGIDGLRLEADRVSAENALTENVIESIEASNAKGAAAFADLIAAFERFLLKGHSSEVTTDATVELRIVSTRLRGCHENRLFVR
jgi:chromosome segregation ATPase